MAVRWSRVARVGPGKEAEAHDASVRICAYAKEHFDIEVSWGYLWAGPTGTMYWSTDYDSMGHWEEVSMSMVADEGWGKLMDEGPAIWPDGGTDTIVRLE